MPPVWLLRARVTPPQHLRPLIPRPKAIQSLTRFGDAPIAFVCAPPGYGKSALLEQWTELRCHRGARRAWLTLDDADDADSTLQYLAFAFHVAGLGLPATAFADESAGQPRARRLQTLLGAIERSGDSWVLVIDDLERAHETLIREIVDPLVRLMPRCLALGLGSRRANVVDLSDVADRGLVTSIGPQHLRFDRDDVRLVLGGSANASQVQFVEQQTAGWPALVQIMGEHNLTATTAAQDLSLENSAALSLFFENRILRRMDPACSGLLARLSLLPHFTAEFVDELQGGEGVWRDLELLEGLGILYRASDEHPDALAVRPLFRGWFERRYLASDASEARELQRRASRVFLRRNRHVEAVRMAASTGDAAFLAEVVEACEPVNNWLISGLQALHQLLRWVPEELARTRPRIGYAFLISWVKAGRIKDAQQLYESLERLADDGVRMERALCRSMLAVYRGIPVSHAEIDEMERLMSEFPAFAAVLGAMATTLRCYELQHAGALAEARQAARDCLRYADQADSKYAAFFIYCDLGMISGVEGDAAQAAEHFEEAGRIGHTALRGDERLAVVRDVFRLELEHELNPREIRSLARLQNVCVRLPKLEGWLDVFAAAFRTYSEKLFLAGDLPTALATLSVGIDILREQDIVSFANVLLAQRVFLLALAGKPAEARGELAQLESAMAADRFNDRRSWREMEAFVEASAAVDLTDGTTRSIEMLQRQAQKARATGNVRSELRLCRLLQALADSDEDEALAARIEDLETRYRFTRSACLLEARASHSGSRVPVQTEFFTQRELQVMERVAEGRSDKAIAMELGISAHGIRYHLKRIYAKLNVRGRAEVRAKAVQLGIRPADPDRGDPYQSGSDPS
jgi:LuxR family transcriptional regulator, maltose regulon positive regulatory protein